MIGIFDVYFWSSWIDLNIDICQLGRIIIIIISLIVHRV